MRLLLYCFVLAFCTASTIAPVYGQDDVDDLFEVDLPADVPAELREAIERRRQEAKGEGDSITEGDEKEDGISDEDQKLLDEFFKELEDIVDGSGKRAQTISDLKDELQAEYRTNELVLKDNPEERKLMDRQKLIAQYYMDLSTRSVESDPRKMHERVSTVSKRVREFRKAHPKLSRLEDFRTRERAIRNSAMQRGGGFGGFGFDRNSSMLTTMKSLSATGVAPDIWEPKVTRAHPGEENGVLQENAFALRRLLRLRWDGEQLDLDRNHWGDAFAGETLQSIVKDVDHLLEERGVTAIVNDDENRNRQRMIMMNGMAQGVDGSASHLGRIFKELQSSGGGYSGGGGNGRWTTESNSLSASLALNGTNFQFRFTEASFPNRTVILNSKDGALRFIVLGDLVHRFTQHTGEKVQVTEILNDEVINHTAQTFAALYRTQPRYVEDRFFPLLEHVGIVPPLSRFDAPVVQRVCELLKGNRAEVKERFDAIAVNLDVDEFTKRDAAYRAIRANLDEFFPFIYEASKDETLSIESRARISKLLEIGNQNGTAELDSMIAGLGLTNDSEYLAELSEIAPADARPALKAQIDSLN